MGFNNDGAEVVAQQLADRAASHARGVRDRSSASTSARPRSCPRTTRRPCSPTTRSSRPACSRPRRLPGRQRQLTQHARPAQPAGGRAARAAARARASRRRRRRRPRGCRCWSRSPPTSPTTTCWPSPTSPLAIELDGIIATNTTISRDGLRSHPAEVEALGAGGLSGRPLTARADRGDAAAARRVGPDLTLVGVGGIATVEDAGRGWTAGADLLQAYTAFIYEGPIWPRRS